ncbi:DMT family transporter [Cohnella cholangitidis]|uniref:DMT family transporter n=1 Tax=Cohnella cholangitidis TaxID=2598458 RepID=UPI002D21CAFA|nr:EamA family transporter [Cohnella cholangitidis]
MSKFKFIILVIVTTFLMGIAFPVGKIGLDYAPPFLLMGLRFVIAGSLLALIVAKKARPAGAKQWLQVAAIGLLQSTGVMGCSYYSMRWITSGESSIMIFTNPLLVIIMGTLLTGAVYRARQWLGVAVGILGVVITLGFHMGLQPGTYISFAGAICFASATLLIKRWGSSFDMTAMAAYQMIFGGLALFVLSAISERPHFEMTVISITSLLWLSLLCSIVQFSLWYYLLGKGDPAKTSAFLFLVPLFGVFTSWLLLGETVVWEVYAGGALICVEYSSSTGKARTDQPTCRSKANAS